MKKNRRRSPQSPGEPPPETEIEPVRRRRTPRFEDPLPADEHAGIGHRGARGGHQRLALEHRHYRGERRRANLGARVAAEHGEQSVAAPLPVEGAEARHQPGALGCIEGAAHPFRQLVRR